MGPGKLLSSLMEVTNGKPRTTWGSCSRETAQEVLKPSQEAGSGQAGGPGCPQTRCMGSLPLAVRASPAVLPPPQCLWRQAVESCGTETYSSERLLRTCGVLSYASHTQAALVWSPAETMEGLQSLRSPLPTSSGICCTRKSPVKSQAPLLAGPQSQSQPRRLWSAAT